jgi:hypothetical protein
MSSDQRRVEIQVDLFGTTHRALLIMGLTPQELIRAIIEEFREIEYLSSTPEAYQLVRLDTQEILDEELPLLTQLAQGRHVQLRERMPILPNGSSRLNQHVYLREETSNTIYKLWWQPAIIGRSDEQLGQNELVAVNLSSHQAGLRISRRHAQISVHNGQILLESLSPNATRIRRGPQVIDVKGSAALQPGDLIDLARGQVLLRFMQRPEGTP